EFEFAAAFIDLNAYDTLVTQKGPDDLNTYVPVLAKSWTVSPDGKEYTFTLRDDVKFASGNPLTADDVKFSLMRLKNIKGNPGWNVTRPTSRVRPSSPGSTCATSRPRRRRSCRWKTAMSTSHSA